MSNNYISIRVSTLRGDQKINFDAYIKIDDKWIHYLRKGDSFEKERLNRLKSKKLKKLFITSDQESFYQKYLELNITSAYDKNSNKPIEDRAEIIQGAQQSLTEDILENIGSAEMYKKTKNETARYVDFLIQNSEAARAMTSIANTDNSLSHHAVNVSTYAVALAQLLGKFDDKAKNILALGGLLHDYGHHGSKLNLTEPLSQLSKEDLAIYNNHSIMGAETVKDKEHIDKAVLQIIYQHEEKNDGSGPLKYTEKKIDPLALIVSCVNSFDRLTSFEGLDKKEALKTLKINGIGKYPLDYIQKLVSFSS